MRETHSPLAKRPGGAIGWLLLLASVVSFVVGAFLALSRADDDYCFTSDFGQRIAASGYESRPSVWPFGRVCTYIEDGEVVAVDEPSYWAGISLLASLVCFAWAMRSPRGSPFRSQRAAEGGN